MKKLNFELTPHEMSTSDLIKNYSVLKYKAELHNRIISPLLIIILSLISMFCMCIRNTSSRTNSNIEIIYAILAIISTEGVSLWFSNAIARQESLISVYYISVISTIILLISVINWRLNK
jgi:lipopolysaccharide export LptBFGC system permease protein LptF